MITESYLNFLGNKIKNLQTALFFDLSTSILKFPTSVITISDIDAAGNIRFIVRRPYIDMSGIREYFFSQLQFYNKGSNYYINIQGKASILTKETHKPIDQNWVAGDNEVLISVHITSAEYFPRLRKVRPAFKIYIDRVKDWCWSNGLQETTIKMSALLKR